MFAAPSDYDSIKDVLPDAPSVHQNGIKDLQLVDSLERSINGYYVNVPGEGGEEGAREGRGDAGGRQQQVVSPEEVPEQYKHYVVSKTSYTAFHVFNSAVSDACFVMIVLQTFPESQITTTSVPCYVYMSCTSSSNQ